MNFRVADPLVFKGPCLESISCSTPPLTTARKGARRRSKSERAIRDSAVLSKIDKDWAGGPGFGGLNYPVVGGRAFGAALNLRVPQLFTFSE